MSIELMKQAVEALEKMVAPRSFQAHAFCQETHDLLLQAIAKAENQEPINEEAFQAYCKTLPPLWNTRISRTEAEGFFKAGYEAATLEQNNGQNTP